MQETTREGYVMNITISQIPYTTDYYVWLNSTRVVLSREELLTLRQLIEGALK